MDRPGQDASPSPDAVAAPRPETARASSPDPVRLPLPDPDAVADLRQLISRSARVDPGGAARLVGRRDVLATYVAPLPGGGGPIVLGLRVLRLAGPCEVDLTASLSALDRRLAGTGGSSPAMVTLDVPPIAASAAPWAGMSPPRSGWHPVGMLDVDELRAVVAAGVAEIVAGTPPGAGLPQVAALRARVWGRPLVPQLDGVPAGHAFAADALAFLDDAEPAAVYRHGAWSRLSTSRGHTLARSPLLI